MILWDNYVNPRQIIRAPVSATTAQVLHPNGSTGDFILKTVSG